ncbi:hypothetical protein RKD30_005829 [Streptomyces pristinaespiralis]
MTAVLPSVRPWTFPGRLGARRSSGAGAGVVTDIGALGSERFPAASRARTVKLYAVRGASPSTSTMCLLPGRDFTLVPKR